MRLFRYIVAVAFLVGFLGQARAQEGIPVYLDYLSDNYYLVYPSMAGIGYSGKVRLTARQQWFGVDRAPNLQTINAHTRLGDRSGVGAIIFRDQNGYQSQAGLQLTYAHHINFWRDRGLNQLSFGLSAGFVQNSLDESDFDPLDFDPIIAGIKQSTTYYNIDLGVSYNIMDIYAHVAVKNLLFVRRDINTEVESANQRRFLTSVGYLFEAKKNSGWLLEPSLLYQWSDATSEQSIDINFKAYKELTFGTLWGGLSFRQSFDGAEFLDGIQVRDQQLQWLSPIIGVDYKDFMFAYTYSYQFGDVTFDAGGFHQITLGYDFWKSKEPVPCHCPWVD